MRTGTELRRLARASRALWQAIALSRLQVFSKLTVFGVVITEFEQRLIAEPTRDGMANARAKGSRPGRPPLNQEKLEAAILLVRESMSPARAARQIGLCRTTLYR